MPRWIGTCIFALLFTAAGPVVGQTAQVTLKWTASRDSNVDGYRLFARRANRNYNYSAPVWEGIDSFCTIDQLEDNTEYCFVVRAFDMADNESGDSNEVTYRTSGPNLPASPPELPDIENNPDAPPNPFQPENPDDQLPGNQDAALDPAPPEVPNLVAPADHSRHVSLETDLISGVFDDSNGEDRHTHTRWLIFRSSDDYCVLDHVSATCLTTLTLPPLVLDGNRRYYWTVQYYNQRGAVSLPSPSNSFTTTAWALDDNANGIPDSHEVLNDTDLDRNGIADSNQSDIKCFISANGYQIIGVKVTTGWPLDRLQAAQPVNASTISIPSGPHAAMPFGLANFKIRLDPSARSAVVTIYYSNQITGNYYWLAFDPSQGYVDYSGNSTISSDRRTVTFQIRDGELGDMDGVANGTIVAMAGYGSPDTNETSAAVSSNTASSDGSRYSASGASCFIDALCLP